MKAKCSSGGCEQLRRKALAAANPISIAMTESSTDFNGMPLPEDKHLRAVVVAFGLCRLNLMDNGYLTDLFKALRMLENHYENTALTYQTGLAAILTKKTKAFKTIKKRQEMHEQIYECIFRMPIVLAIMKAAKGNSG